MDIYPGAGLGQLGERSGGGVAWGAGGGVGWVGGWGGVAGGLGWLGVRGGGVVGGLGVQGFLWSLREFEFLDLSRFLGLERLEPF